MLHGKWIPLSLQCVPKHRWIPEVSEVSHDCSVRTATPRKWKLARRDAREFGDVFWWEITQPRESTQVMTKDAGHQVKETHKEKWVQNELMTQYLRNKLRQEHNHVPDDVKQ